MASRNAQERERVRQILMRWRTEQDYTLIEAVEALRDVFAGEISEAFGDLSDAALAGLAGATPEQKARIEDFILRECYPMHDRAAILQTDGEHVLLQDAGGRLYSVPRQFVVPVTP